LRQRLSHDLRSSTDTNAYTLGDPTEDPLGDLPPNRYLPLLLNGGPASLVGWEDDSEVSVMISAHVLQEVIMDDEAIAAWPRCPAHQHALIATRISEVAVWSCPSDDSLWWRIGDLPMANEGEVPSPVG
jgi:hypothetical protein